jgi:hypothetical protein
MKKLTKVLAALMLVGFGFSFNAHANGSCGFDGNNPGGLSFSECVRQEYLKNGARIFNKNLKAGFVQKVFQENTLEDGIKEIERMANATISTLESDEKINEAKFNLKSVILYIRTFSVKEIRRMASSYNSASL